MPHDSLISRRVSFEDASNRALLDLLLLFLLNPILLMITFAVFSRQEV